MLAREDELDSLIEDADRRGWDREVERHQSTKRRLEQILVVLNETGLLASSS